MITFCLSDCWTLFLVAKTLNPSLERFAKGSRSCAALGTTAASASLAQLCFWAFGLRHLQ